MNKVGRSALLWLVVMSLGCMINHTSAVVLDFEYAVGHDVEPISNFYSGITFLAGSSGSEWVFRDCLNGNYNVSSFPSGDILGGDGEYWIYGFGAATTALDDTGNTGIISFDDAKATYVELGYSYYDITGAGGDLTLSAFDQSGNLLDSDIGFSNLRFLNMNAGGPGTLRVDAPAGQLISYVEVTDAGNYWIIDNVDTDASGITNIAPDAADRSSRFGRNLYVYCHGYGQPAIGTHLVRLHIHRAVSSSHRTLL